MAEFYVEYNDIILSLLLNVKDIETTILPQRETSSVYIHGRPGELFNGSRDGIREIKITFNIKKTTQEDYNYAINDVKSCFDVNEPKALYINDREKFIYAIPDGDINFGDMIISNNACYGEGEVTFKCFDPYYYSEVAQNFESDDNNVECVNLGDIDTYPLISVGFGADSTFLQAENTNTGQKILIGSYPSISKSTTSKVTTVLNDHCQSLADWTQTAASVDIGRAITGTAGVNNETGESFRGIDFGSASEGSTWHGPAIRRNLNTTVQDFEVVCEMYHNSPGRNGDPNVGDPNASSGSPGTTTAYYKVDTRSNLNLTVRSGPGTKYKKIGSIANGYKITGATVTGSWLKFTYKGKTAYVYKAYTRKVTNTTGSTAEQMNYMTNAESLAIRASASKTSKNLKTLKEGTKVRCYTKKYYDSKNKCYYQKLAKPVGGKTGYVLSKYLVEMSDIYVESDEEYDYADDKMGVVEVYGFSEAGNKIFKFCLVDDNAYYENTRPILQIGNEYTLEDSKSMAPKPKTTSYTENDGKLTVEKKKVRSGIYGGWQGGAGIDFKFTIRRTGYKWEAIVVKRKDNKETSAKLTKTITKSSYPNEPLSYLVCYFGQNKEAPVSTMSVQYIKVSNTNTTIKPSDNNIIQFHEGDVVDIDCCNNLVYLNSSPINDQIDIGSEFFPLVPGDNDIKVLSEDANMNTSVIFNERWL